MHTTWFFQKVIQSGLVQGWSRSGVSAPAQGNVEGPLSFGWSPTLAPKMEVKTGIYSFTDDMF